MWLIKIHSSSDIFGNDAVMLPKFGDAIDLNGEHHRDSRILQFAGKEDHRRGAPTVPEENDVRTRFFGIRKRTVVIVIQQAKNGFKSLFPAAVFENPDVRIFRKFLLDALGENYRAMMWIIVTDETTRKSHQDVRGSLCRGKTGNTPISSIKMRRENCEERSRRREQQRTSCEAGHGESPVRKMMDATEGMRQKIRHRRLLSRLPHRTGQNP